MNFDKLDIKEKHSVDITIDGIILCDSVIDFDKEYKSWIINEKCTYADELNLSAFDSLRRAVGSLGSDIYQIEDTIKVVKDGEFITNINGFMSKNHNNVDIWFQETYVNDSPHSYYEGDVGVYKRVGNNTNHLSIKVENLIIDDVKSVFVNGIEFDKRK